MIGRRTITGFVVATLLVTACGGDDDTADATDPATTPATAASATTETTAVPSGDEDTAPATTAPATTEPDATQPPTATEPPAEQRLMEALGVPAIEISTPPAGGGERPLLEWVAVDGATAYHVVVQSDGEPYWAWVGDTTSVPFGGGDASSGPGLLAVVTPDAAFTFTVTAWGADDELLGASPPSQLAP